MTPVEFEKKYGSIELVKAAISVINQILSDKGIVSEEEITERFFKEIDNRINSKGNYAAMDAELDRESK